MGRIAAAVLSAALLSPLLAACGGTKHGGFATLSTDGQVMVTPPTGGQHLVRSGSSLQAGDTVDVVTRAAQIILGADGAIQLRSGTRLTLGGTIQLLQGAVLVQPASGHILRVATNQATLVVPGGAVQVAADPNPAVMVVKVYQGSSELDVPATASGSTPQTLDVAAPRELLITPTNSPLPVPLQYQESDAWDHQYLADAERVSAQLTAAVTGFNAQVPSNDGSSAAFYQQLVPALASHSDFSSSLSAVQNLQIQHAAGTAAPKPGDYLIAAIIAIRGTHGSLQSRLTNELTFYAQGAPWGFVAYDQGITNLDGVLDDVLAAIARAPLPFSSGPSSQIAIAPPTTTVPTTPTTVAPRRTTPTTTPVEHPVSPTTPTTQPKSPATTPTTAAPAIQLPVPNVPGPLGQILNPLLDPLIQALNNILAGRL